MSGRGLTKQGTQNFVKFGLPFMSFVVIGSYGLSEWVGAKIRMKDEKRQQVLQHPRDASCHKLLSTISLADCAICEYVAGSGPRRRRFWTSYETEKNGQTKGYSVRSRRSRRSLTPRQSMRSLWQRPTTRLTTRISQGKKLARDEAEDTNQLIWKTNGTVCIILSLSFVLSQFVSVSSRLLCFCPSLLGSGIVFVSTPPPSLLR